MEINKEDDTNIGCDVLYILMNPTTYSIIICLYLVPPASGNISSNHSSQSRHCTSQVSLSDSHSPAPILIHKADFEQTYILPVPVWPQPTFLSDRQSYSSALQSYSSCNFWSQHKKGHFPCFHLENVLRCKILLNWIRCITETCIIMHYSALCFAILLQNPHSNA